MASVKQSSQSEQSIKLESSADSHVESVSHQDEKHIVQENCSGRCEDNLLDTDHEKSFVVNSSDLAQLSAVTAGDCAKSEELKLSAVTAGDCAKSEELKLSAVTAGDCAKSEELKLSAVTAGDCAKSEKLKLSAVTAGDCAKSEKLKLSAVTAGDCAKSEELKLSAVTADDCAKSEELKLSAVTAGDCAKSEELKLSAVTADDYAKSEELTPSLRDTKFHTKLEDNDAEDRLTDTVEVCDVSEEATNLCVVCQNAPVFYTLLQCRHACVCFTCIKLLEKCPMCRGFIDSYFRLDAAPDPVISDSVEEVVGPRVPWWEALNNRLNHLLGFE